MAEEAFLEWVIGGQATLVTNILARPLPILSEIIILIYHIGQWK
jgi:hypothetical protein